VNAPTPRPTSCSNVLPPYASSPATAQPEVHLHPVTPSSTGFKITHMVRGINEELEATQQELNATSNARQTIAAHPTSAPAERNPFHDNPNARPIISNRNPTPRSAMRDTTKIRMHLLDVTGLPNAAESPMKHGAQHYPYKANERPRESEGASSKTDLFLLLLTFFSCSISAPPPNSNRSSKIARSGRGKWDLPPMEMVLECKHQVARESAVIRPRGDKHSLSYRRWRRTGGNQSERYNGWSTRGRLHERYKEAVEEKRSVFHCLIANYSLIFGILF
jgi:hypothetical protein